MERLQIYFFIGQLFVHRLFLPHERKLTDFDYDFRHVCSLYLLQIVNNFNFSLGKTNGLKLCSNYKRNELFVDSLMKLNFHLSLEVGLTKFLISPKINFLHRLTLLLRRKKKLRYFPVSTQRKRIESPTKNN